MRVEMDGPTLPPHANLSLQWSHARVRVEMKRNGRVYRLKMQLQWSHARVRVEICLWLLAVERYEALQWS
ncbi:MAG: hypothetical protein ACREBG_27245, partial [Pyrinomonadaceae bacterium]